MASYSYPGTWAWRVTHIEGDTDIYLLFDINVYTCAVTIHARHSTRRSDNPLTGWIYFDFLRVPLHFSFFVLSFRVADFPFVSWIALFAFLFASLISFVADSVFLLSRLGATPPPSCLRAWPRYMRIPPCVLFSSLRSWVDLFYFFLLFPPFFSFPFGRRLFHPVFFLWVLYYIRVCCLLGFRRCCDSFSMICILIRKYVRWSQLFIFGLSSGPDFVPFIICPIDFMPVFPGNTFHFILFRFPFVLP